MTKMPSWQRRISQHINQPVTQSAFRAFDYAKAIGKPLNTYVVINLRDEAEIGATSSFSAIRHKFRDWLTNKAKKFEKVSPMYVYAHENPNNNTHVNWVLHVPEEFEAEFGLKLRRWIEKVQGPLGPFDLNIQPVNVSFDKRLAKYILKGTDARYINHFYLQDVYKGSQGEVHGRRVGISQAIGKKARKKNNFHPGRNRPYQQQHISSGNTETVQPAA